MVIKAQTILLVGACGSGKTYAVTTFMQQLNTTKLKLGLIKFQCDMDKRIVVLGVYDGTTYQGSDKLSMAVMKDIGSLRLWQKQRGFTIIAEGDRFTNKTFIQTMEPTIIKLVNDGEAGRAKRGTTQSQRQIKAIATRVANINAHHHVQTGNEAATLLQRLTTNP